MDKHWADNQPKRWKHISHTALNRRKANMENNNLTTNNKEKFSNFLNIVDN